MHYSKTTEELQRSFSSALAEFAAKCDDDSRSNLFIFYNRLLYSVREDDDNREEILRFVFSSLVEKLDEAEGEVAEVLYMYTFRDFLESYGEEPAIQTAIGEYLEFGRLCKPPLQIALGVRRKK